MCRAPAWSASLCCDASVSGPSEGGLSVGHRCSAEEAGGQAVWQEHSRVDPGGESAENFPRGCHLGVQGSSGAPQSRPGLFWNGFGMPQGQAPSAPAASPTQQAWAEAGPSVVAIPRQGCFRAPEAYRGCSGSQRAEPVLHAVPSSQVDLDQAEMTRNHRVCLRRSEDQRAEPVLHHAVLSPQLAVHQHEVSQIPRVR